MNFLKYFRDFFLISNRKFYYIKSACTYKYNKRELIHILKRMYNLYFIQIIMYAAGL